MSSHDDNTECDDCDKLFPFFDLFSSVFSRSLSISVIDDVMENYKMNIIIKLLIAPFFDSKNL
jgi:hypothetical protein